MYHLFGGTGFCGRGIAIQHVERGNLLARQAIPLECWLVKDGIVEKNCEHVDAAEIPSFREQECLEKFLNRLLQTESGKFRVIITQRTSEPVEISTPGHFLLSGWPWKGE